MVCRPLAVVAGPTGPVGWHTNEMLHCCNSLTAPETYVDLIKVVATETDVDVAVFGLVWEA